MRAKSKRLFELSERPAKRSEVLSIQQTPPHKIEDQADGAEIRPLVSGEEEKQLAAGTPGESSTVNETSTVPETYTVPVSRSGRIRRACKAQDGHSSGEQCLYAAMWEAGVPESRDSRLITIGWDKMGRLANLAPNNARVACGRLIEKLALDVVAPENSNLRTGRTYRVWSWAKLIERRIGAGMEWYLKTRGVEFVRPPGAFPEAQMRWDARQKHSERGTVDVSRTVLETSTDTGDVSRGDTVHVSSPPLKHFESNLKAVEAPSSSVVASVLQKYLTERPDDDGIAMLVNQCHAAAPDATEEEIAHFVGVKADQAIRMRSVRNLMGFLLTAVPRALTPAALADLRDCRARQAEAARLEEEERQAQFNELVAEQRAVLANPSATEEDRLFAARFLENVGQA